MRSFSIVTIMLCFTVLSAVAQQSMISGEYLVNRFALSPANAGLNGASELFTSYREQWSKLENAPIIGGISGHMTLKKNTGVGFKVNVLNSGLFNQLNAQAAYAYHVKTGVHSFLSFGLAAGLKRVSLNLSDASVLDDPYVGQTQLVNGRLLDAEFGIDYTSRTFSAGLSVPQLSSGRVEAYNSTGNKNTLYSTKMQYRLYAFKSITLDKNWLLQPSVLINKTESVLMYDVNAVFNLREQLWLGGTYRSSGATCMVLGFRFSRLMVNYMYEFSNKGIQAVGGATHDLAVGFIIGKNHPKLTEPALMKGIRNTPPYSKWE